MEHIRELNTYHVYNYSKYKSLVNYNYPFDLQTENDPRTGLKIPKGDKTYQFKHGYDFEQLMVGGERWFEILSSTSDEVGELKSLLWDLLSYIAAIREKGVERLFKNLESEANECSKHIEALFQPKSCNTSGGQTLAVPKKEDLKRLLDPIEKRFAGNEGAEDYFKKSLGNSLEENKPLIFGHTHRPFHYEKDKKMAINLGSWITFTDRAVNTYLEILDGEERLFAYPSRIPIDKTHELTVM